jgi:hypothetical protein
MMWFDVQNLTTINWSMGGIISLWANFSTLYRILYKVFLIFQFENGVHVSLNASSQLLDPANSIDAMLQYTSFYEASKI